MQVGRNFASFAELADLGFIFNSTLHQTPWLSSTMCSFDSCSSEILGLGKHVCYADSRTTNFTRLTSLPSVRLRTATRTCFFNCCCFLTICLSNHSLFARVVFLLMLCAHQPLFVVMAFSNEMTHI